MSRTNWLGAIVGVAIGAVSLTAHADVVKDSVNLGATSDTGAFWGATDVGWLYTPASSYNLSGVETNFSIPRLTSVQNRTVTVVLYQGNTPPNGGTLLGSFDFDSSVAFNTVGGGTFATPIALTGGTQYFVGFENVGPLSGPPPIPNVDDLGVNFTADAGATFLSNLFFDSDNSKTFSVEDTNTDILGEPILAFLTPSPKTSPVPEPSSLVLIGTALVALGKARRKRQAA